MIRSFRKILISVLISAVAFQLFPQQSISELSWNKVATGMPASWYGSEESVKVAENVLLYQRIVGGWPKNIEKHKQLSEQGKSRILKEKSNLDAIFDNSATTTEMRFLAKMYSNTKNQVYKESFNRGLQFILDAQYDNGGWPMFFPLREGYYTHITFNDNAIVNILRILSDIKDKEPDFTSITDSDKIPFVIKAYDKGIEIILKTQIKVDGKPTVWCAQHDEKTFLPAKARSYELPSFSGGESAGIIMFLMEIPDPGPEIIVSVTAAVEWLEAHRLKHIKWENFTNKDGLSDRRIVNDQSAGDMWARFYDLKTGKPFFCDRDGIKKNSLEEIGHERRNGYSWYTDAPQKVLDKYPSWKNKWIK